jgi:glycerophosphoryl diester phosphodiesterase
MLDFGKIIAHRGASGYLPENTLAAFRRAKELGAQWIECDAKLTWDNEVVIFHDSRLSRLTQLKGWVRWTKYADLIQLDIGLGEHVLRLDELLDFADEIDLAVNLEIKPDWGRVRKTTKKIMSILAQKPRKNILISSFNRKSLSIVRSLDKTIPIGLLMDKWSHLWKFIAQRLNCVTIHCSKHAINHKRVMAIKKTGRQVLVYTVNAREEAKILFALGVDAIFSDYPDLLLRVVEGNPTIK